MALHDEILREIMAHRVPWRFKTGDLKRIPGANPGGFRVGNGEYSENTINTVPRNHSVRPDGTDRGDYVRKGRKPAFLWHGSGVYELVLDRQHEFEVASPEDEEFDVTEGDAEALFFGKRGRISSSPLALKVDDASVLRITKTQHPDPAAIIVRYLAEKRFQTYYRREPVGTTKIGWGERLAAYYWPVPDQDWQKTCPIVTRLSSQIQTAIHELEVRDGGRAAAGQLLNAFKETCAWGGVRLPEADPGVLAAEVLRTWQALSRGRKPPSGCRLNSAWTKLYAFAFPDQCVIVTVQPPSTAAGARARAERRGGGSRSRRGTPARCGAA
jgi:hypothetical protein